jgi:hypothetical protein
VFQKVAAIFKQKSASPEDVLLCSNSMSLPIHTIASGVEREYRHRCIGLRFLGRVLFVDEVAVTYQSHQHALSVAGHVQRVLHSLELTQAGQMEARGPSFGHGETSRRRTLKPLFAARSTPCEQPSTPNGAVTRRCCAESVPMRVQMHTVRQPVASNVEAFCDSGPYGTQTGYCFYGHILPKGFFLALETNGAIFAGRQRSDNIPCGKVVLSDGGGMLRAQRGGTDECIVVGKCVEQRETQQTCAHYLLDLKSMLNARGLWGLVAFTVQDGMDCAAGQQPERE